MRTKIIFSLLLFVISLKGFSTIWTVTNSGFTFSPATITIVFGDTVDFNVTSEHNAAEVSLATWNINDNTPLSGGFQTPFGGGMVFPAQLSVGTHYYVCEAHASMGMKGIVIVQNCTIPTQPGIISGNATVCSGSTNTYSVTAVAGATSYIWTLPGGWTGNSNTNSIIAVAGILAGNISVAANNACGPSPVRTLNVAVNTPPAQPGAITGNNPICSGTSNTYSINTVTGATSYTWNLPGGWTGTSTTTTILATASTTSGNVTISANNTCGPSTLRILNVTVNTAPAQPSAIIGNASVCQDSSNTYSVTPVTGATSYTWNLPVGWTGNSITNIINAIAGSISGNISVTANNNCGSSIQRLLGISINTPLAQPGIISGSDSVCAETLNFYSILPVTGAVSYTWMLPLGWTGTSITNSINVVAGSSSGNISVMANNACGTSVAQTKSIFLNLVDTSVFVSGNSITAVVAAANYVWLDCNSNLPVPGQTNQSFTPTVTGDYAVVVTINGCSDTSSCYNITIVGIHENAPSSAVALFPNPSDGKFLITSKIKSNEKVEIFNLMGEKILQSNIHGQNTAIDISNHPSGIYFVKIYAENTVYTKKILIQ